MKVYLDNAATTKVDKEVLEFMLPFLENSFGNPSSTHSHGREAKVAIEKARKTVATLIGASPSEIYFTSGGTESDNMAIRGYIHTYQLKHAITSPLEHHAVLHTLEELAHNGDIKLSLVNIDEKGTIDLAHLASLLAENGPSLVSLMHGNNEIGNLIDLAAVGELCKANQSYFHSDTVQTMGYYPLNAGELPVHALVGSAHKFHGPKGVGFLYMKSDAKVKSFITGGGQERGHRGGTENVAGIVGLAKALSLSFGRQEAHRAHVLALKKHFIERLTAEIPHVDFNGLSGDLDKSAYKVLNVSFPEGWGNDMLLFSLDLKGISASGGSACSSGANAGSHVLRALHANPNRQSVRFSFSKFNTIGEVDYTVEQLLALGKAAQAVS